VTHFFKPAMLEHPDDELIGALAATIIYATEYLQIVSEAPASRNESLNVWVLNKRINK